MNPYETKIIEFLKAHGAALPTEIKQVIGKDLIFTGAILADLVSRNIIKISIGKIGGSNLYYLPGHEEKLQRLFDYLKDPEKEIFKKLKENKVLFDDDLNAVEKVAIRNIPDFAKKIEINGKPAWRWYLIDETRAKDIILGKNEVKNIIVKDQEKHVKTESKKATENKTIIEKLKQPTKEQKNDVNIQFKEWLKRNQFEMKKTLLNAKGFMIIEAYGGILEAVIGFHQKRKVTENDLILFYGYCQLYQKPGILVFTNELNQKAKAIRMKLPIKIFSLKYNRFE